MKNRENNIENSNDIRFKSYGHKDNNFSAFTIIFLSVACYFCICRVIAYSESLTSLKTTETERMIIEDQIQNSPGGWSEITRYARNLNRFFIYHRNFYLIPDEEKVTESDMAEDMAIINRNLNTNLTKAVQEYNEIILNPQSSEADKNLAESNFKNSIEKLTNDYSYDASLARSARLRDKISNYFAIENYLDTTREFTYYINDEVLGRSFSNVVGSNLESYMENEIYLSLDLSRIHETFNGIALSESFGQSGITGFIMVPKDQPAGSVITSSIDSARLAKEDRAERAEKQLMIFSAILTAAILLGILILIRISIVDPHATLKGFLMVFRQYLKLPLLMKLAATIIAYKIILYVSSTATDPFDNYSISTASQGLSQFLALYICVLIIIFTISFLVFIFQGKHRLAMEFEYRLFHKSLYSLSVMRKISPFVLPAIWLIVALGGMIFLALGLFFALRYALEGIVFFGLCLTLSAVIFTFLIIFANYAKLSYYIKNIHEGNLISIPEENGPFSKPINMLNGLSEGLKVTLGEMVSAERTKTELITNVSHDLKTPLTNIINYVNLLKESHLEDPNAREYVNILEQKSERLRILIEDLFEAAKLSSQSMKLSYESLDVVQLLEQAIGELSEKFENKEIEIKFKTNVEKIPLFLDGQRIWRVFENLLNNMANYSPAGSRAYINIEDRGEAVEIVMKNISVFELDFNPVELFERFKRGDPARTTEGSGLGLSISRDIVELHGGKMDIVIDGDLFKVIISLGKLRPSE